MDKKDYRVILGERLKMFRESRGISAYRVSKKGNIEIYHVNSVESGLTNYTIDTFVGYLIGCDLYVYFAEKDNNSEFTNFNDLISKM